MLYAAAALLVVSGWLRLEAGDGSYGRALALAALALLPALPRPTWARAVAAAAVSLVAIRVALGLSVTDARPFDGRDFFGPLVASLVDGVGDYYDVAQPFDGAEHPLMRGVLLVAVFVFCLALALAITARRPLAAAVALLAGAAWPATLVPGRDLARGAVMLAVVLALLAAARARPPRAYRPALLAAAALVVAAVAAGASPAVAKDEFVSWREWDPYDRSANPVAVKYVWNANYGGIRFPKKRTTVLTVAGPERPLYWRATALDRFEADRWLEDLSPGIRAAGRVTLDTDPFLPRAARRRPAGWTQARVRIEALRDEHLPVPAMPVAYEPDGLGVVHYHQDNIATVIGGLEADDEYTVWSYTPRPTPAQLSRVGSPKLPPHVRPYLEVARGTPVPPLGAAGREATVERLFGDPLHRPFLTPYRALYEQARAVVGTPKTQYAAVVALEAWFRRGGGFRYDERPPQRGGAPPLVSFVTTTRRGYCQHFAGAMALMLRYLGVPARVAAGFTSGEYDARRREWRVTDHDAHTWVEVFFPGWGWLPFDPTPGRGRLSGAYTAASRAFDSIAARDLVRGGAAATGLGLQVLGELAESRLQGTRVGDAPGDLGGGRGGGLGRGNSLLGLLAAFAGGLALAVVLLKLVRRRARYATRDPRRIAAACRRELVEFLADQHVDVPSSATLPELGAVVSRRFAVDARPFVAAAEGARFGPPAQRALAGRRARAEVRALRRLLRRRLSAWRRTRGALSVRSLTS